MIKINADFEGWLDDALRRNGFLFPNTDKQMDEFIKKINNTMKREIKFRGKSLDTGEWVYGNLIIAENGAPYIFPPEICEVDGHHLRQGDDKPHWVDPATVGQFTGMKDRNGREIYEDDLFKAGYYDTIYRVEWDKENARYIGRDEKGRISYVGREPAIEVCGNIHENTELLTK